MRCFNHSLRGNCQELWRFGHQQEIWDAWIRDKGQFNTRSNSSSQRITIFLCWSPKPQFPLGGQTGPDDTFTLSGACHGRGAELRKPQAFITGCMQTCSICLGGALLCWTANKPALCSRGWYRLCLQGSLLCKQPCKDKVEQKQSPPLPGTGAETGQTMKNRLPIAASFDFSSCTQISKLPKPVCLFS